MRKVRLRFRIKKNQRCQPYFFGIYYIWLQNRGLGGIIDTLRIQKQKMTKTEKFIINVFEIVMKCALLRSSIGEKNEVIDCAAKSRDVELKLELDKK